MTESIVFTRHPDGSVTADRFPEEIGISACWIGEIPGPDPGILRRDGDRVHITAANGEATYLITEHDGGLTAYCSRLYARGPAAECS